MRTIHKYQFSINDTVAIPMPRGAEILDVQVQHDTPCMWAIVETTAPIDMAHFLIRGTGHALPEATSKVDYVATFQVRGGMLVFHMFRAVSP